MTDITLYNTATRQKERFEPLDDKNVRMYVCGPTVYDRAHIGNARPVIVFDVLYRLLRHVYGAEHVTYVRNFTDVDDKINATALSRKEAGAAGSLEELIAERTDETIRWYLEDMEALGARKPSIKGVETDEAMPRATGWIGQMITMIEGLIAKSHAYEREGHVLFRVRSYEAYGALSGRSVDDMIAGARVEVAPYKEDPMDFVLWKPSSDDLPGWDSPWGRGRPGWHIECSAMAYELLGETFDIHGGGNDLQFPHHENEIAQSKCAGHGFARFWMHNEMLQVEGKKMSKSLGNFFTVRDLLEGNWSGGWKVPGEVIRFVFLSTHYRKPMDWTEAKAREAEATLEQIGLVLAGYQYMFDERAVPSGDVVEALVDDLNSSLALTNIRRMLKELSNRDLGSSLDHAKFEETAARLIGSLELLGFRAKSLVELATSSRSEPSPDIADLITSLLEARSLARKAKDFARADELRDGFAAAGVLVKDTSEGAEWELSPKFDPAKLEALK